MNELEKQLLQTETGETSTKLCVRSDACIDAGRWWRRTPLWLCVVGEDLVMLAVARRKYFARMKIADCASSHYSHLTGELIIEPGESLRFNRFKVSTDEAIRILKILNPDSVIQKSQKITP